MLEPLKKSLRAVRRDYFDSSGMGAVFGTVFFAGGCVAAVAALFVPVSPPLLVFMLGSLLVSGGIVGAGSVAGKINAQKREQAWIPDAQSGKTHIVGPGLKVTTLVNTQEIVTKLTSDLSRSPTLPQDVQKKLEPWLRDAEEAAKEVQGWDSTGNPVATIGFVREVFNAQGQKVEMPIASYGLFNPAAAPQPAPAPAPVASTVIVLPKTITLKNQQKP